MDNKGFKSDEKADPASVVIDNVEDRPIADPEKLQLSMATKPYPGMNKEDLLRFSETPFWRRMRMASLVIFCLVWLGLLAAVIALTIVWPRCKTAPSQEWWQTSAMYQVYPKSFQDSNNDGIGDLKGIENRLTYLKELKTDTVVLSSVYKTDKIDHGYDVTNHTLIEDIFGSMDDFDALLKKIHDEKMYLVVDFIPNHTSNKHPWFIESKKGGTSNAYQNYYVWADCANETSPPPNNWLSVYGGSAWTWDAERKQCYLHQFLTQQPELNIRSTKVKEELENILRYWLDKGVDGFRINSVAYLFEDYDLRDEPLASGLSGPTTDYNSLNHIYTKSLSEVHDMVARWRSILDEYSSDTNRKRFLMTDADVPVSESMNYYEYLGRKGAHLPQNFLLSSQLSPGCGGACVETAVMAWTRNMPQGSTANWLVGSQNHARIASQLGQYSRSAALLMLLLPGTPMLYYGEELGMVNANLTSSKDPGYPNVTISRDRVRTPMQWTNETNAGFVNGTSPSWLPVNPTSSQNNVMVQSEDSSSMLNLYRSLLNLRQQNAFKYGSPAHIAVVNDDVFSFVREYDGQERYLVSVNFGTKESTVNYATDHFMIPSDGGEVVETTRNDVKLSGKRSLDGVKLEPGQGVVFKWDAPPR